MAGDILFGNMVSALVVDAVESVHGYSLVEYTHPNETIEAAIKSGKFLLPSAFEWKFPNPQLEG